MGKKRKPAAMDTHNQYVMDLGAHIPPAPPEKEHARMRGFKSGLFIATAIACMFFVFRPELDKLLDKLFVPGESQASVAATEEPANQHAVWVKAWLGDTLLVNECPEHHDDCGAVHLVSAGDEIRIKAYSAEGKVEKITYYFPSINMKMSELDGDEGYIVVPESEKGTVVLLWIEVTDTKGNRILEEYNLGYL